MHSCNFLVMFTDDPAVIGLVTDDDETAYRKDVHNLTRWWQENNLTLNVDKTNELTVDYKTIHRSAVESQQLHATWRLHQ